MALMLLAGLAGLTKGLSEIKEKKDEETKQLVAARTKTAYQNYLKHQEQVAALKEEVKKRDAEALQFQPDLNDEERVAIATMPNAIDLYKRALAEGRSVGDRTITLRDILKVGDKAKGMKYDDFVNALGKVEPVQQVMMEPRTGLFATSQEKQRRLMETMAGTVGVPTEQLMAFERPREAPRVEPMGALDIETMFREEEKVKTPEQRIQIRQNAYIDAVEQFGADSQEAEAARQAAVDLAARVKSLNPTQEKFADLLDRAKLKAANAQPGTPEHKAAMAEVDRLVVIGKREEAGGDKLPTIPQMRGLFSDTVSRAVQSKFGSLVGKDIAIETSLDGTSTYKYIGTDPNVRQQIREVELRALASQFRTLSDGSGRPLNMDVRRALLAYGVEFDRNGVPIFGGTAPQPQPQPTPPAAPVSPVGASRVAPGAAAPTTRPAAPVVAPAAGAAQPAPVTPQAAPTRRSPEDEDAINWARTTLNNPRSTPLSKKQAQDILKANGIQ